MKYDNKSTFICCWMALFPSSPCLSFRSDLSGVAKHDGNDASTKVHNAVSHLQHVLQVPYWQSRIVQGCRKRGKPVIVATNMLESMITNPTPTRAEVSDIAIAVREGTDAVMLSGETAYGKFPYKSVAVMATVAKRTENAMLTYQVAPG